MDRGIFSSIIKNDAYKNADKKWIVELQRYHKYWYDLVVNPGDVADYFDTKKHIVDYLKNIKIEVEKNLEKRFVYFICTRTKVRFNTKKKISYNYFTKKFKIHLLVGKEQKRKFIKFKILDKSLDFFYKPQINLTEKYITVTDSAGNLITASIHDFLEDLNVNLKISSNVEYVGYTENPHKRPTNGSHTGLSDTLYKVSNENCDTFIYFNLFKVMTQTVSNTSMFNFVISNAMTNEVNVELEGKLIEKCFIFYFNALNQSRNKEKELTELKNNLVRMAGENKINSISVYYEFEDPNEYGIFSSSSVSPNSVHRFSVSMTDDNIEILRGI